MVRLFWIGAAAGSNASDRRATWIEPGGTMAGSIGKCNGWSRRSAAVERPVFRPLEPCVFGCAASHFGMKPDVVTVPANVSRVCPMKAPSLAASLIAIAIGLVDAQSAAAQAPPHPLAGTWIALDDGFPRLVGAGLIVPTEEILHVSADGRAESRLMTISDAFAHNGARGHPSLI